MDAEDPRASQDKAAADGGQRLPLLPGFREMALRRMARDRRLLVTELTAERQAARLSQTEVAARMGTSQSAVARLDSGEADARAATLERYAAAIGCQITWGLRGSVLPGPSDRRADASGPGSARSRAMPVPAPPPPRAEHPAPARGP